MVITVANGVILEHELTRERRVRVQRNGVVAAFARYNARFRAITRRAPERFENRDWSGSQADVVERLELYATAVNATVADMRRRLGEASHDTDLWAGIKSHYLRRIESLADPEFLKTFFSSITRKLFNTIGVDPTSSSSRSSSTRSGARAPKT